MTSPTTSERYKNHRFPGEIISHGVWLSSRFTLSYRDAAELLCECGSTVSHEAIRKWCRKCGQPYANQLRHRRPRPGDNKTRAMPVLGLRRVSVTRSHDRFEWQRRKR